MPTTPARFRLSEQDRARLDRLAQAMTDHDREVLGRRIVPYTRSIALRAALDLAERYLDANPRLPADLLSDALDASGDPPSAE